MLAELDDRLRIALPEASEHLAGVPEAFAVLFKRGDLSSDRREASARSIAPEQMSASRYR